MEPPEVFPVFKGAGAKADHVDTLDLFHTMEAYFTWYPNGAPA